MPDTRRHRGPAPRDRVLFGPDRVEPLRLAVEELSWLLGRGYTVDASLKLVGDRHALTARQRRAVDRCACSDDARDARRARRMRIEQLAGQVVHVDGFNCVILCESVLSGAPVFAGRDGALRDLASVHGTWRRVTETPRAISALAGVLTAAAAEHVVWWLDRPVSNSGRLAAMLRDAGDWDVRLAQHVDRRLAEQDGVVASADAWVMDRCPAWVDLPRAVLERAKPDAWLVELDAGPPVAS